MGVGVRGDEERQESIILFSSLEDRIPADHPLRDIRRVVDRALRDLSPLFDGLYHERGRESIPPEYLLRAQLVQHLYAIPSERRLCEQLEYNLLLRWFVGLPLSEPVWHPTSFTKNRDRVLTSQVAEAFFAAVRAQAEATKLLSREHFSVDGTLIEAAASLVIEPVKESAELLERPVNHPADLPQGMIGGDAVLQRGEKNDRLLPLFISPHSDLPIITMICRLNSIKSGVER